jgi:hypothetical protein
MDRDRLVRHGARRQRRHADAKQDAHEQRRTLCEHLRGDHTDCA